ncbi:MAG: site-2 protease family protein [Bacteroides sp.]|nr:site-2 protease family protein [Bacillota bacterium]MCM1393586.1 site-2 protease family protein [[Eubacterium] siraeum]MCM1454995.1 site-2 protease family protein [Bacteroides sp.]
MQIKVHPLFFVLALALVALGRAWAFALTFVALILHELAHAGFARLRGFAIKKLVLLPFGAMMSTEENFDKGSAVIVGLAGPVCNLLLALITVGIWWIAPAAYAYTEQFFYANLALGLFNLLPIYPLDGSRIVLGLCKNKLKAIKGLQIAGIICSIAFFGLFIGSFFFGLNFTFGIIAVFLFYGAAFGTKDEMYISVLDSASKNYMLGVERKTVRVSEDMPIIRFYHHVSASSETTFEVLDNEGRAVALLSEEKLKDVAVKNRLSKPIKFALFPDSETVEPKKRLRRKPR